MLILTRQNGERIVINEDIVITVISVGSGQVRFGIEAPQSVSIHREEIYEKIQQQDNSTAATQQPDTGETPSIDP